MSAYERESEGIIHESRWAVTQKTGDKVYKIFLHDAYPKIKKEVSLLQLSLATNASLSFDKVMNHWVCKSDYIDIYPLVGNRLYCLLPFSFPLAMGHIGFGMFRTMLEYKLTSQGKAFAKIDKWYPSSKTSGTKRAPAKKWALFLLL